MNDLDDLRDNVRYSKQAEAQTNKWLYGFLMLFPLVGLGSGFVYKNTNKPEINNQEFARIASPLSHETASDTPANHAGTQSQLSENKTFLKMAKVKKNDPYVLASDQARYHNIVIGKLEACSRKNGNQKFVNLQDSYRRRNKSAYKNNQKIILAQTSAQADKFNKFRNKVGKGNKTSQMATILGAKSSGALNQHAAVMMNSFNTFDSGYSSRSISDEECTQLSTDVATGKKNITTPSK